MDEILINTSTTGDQDQAAVAGFRGTQFVAVWADRGSGDIKGQMLGVNGDKTSGEFLVNVPAEPGTKRQLPAVVECGLGFAVAWIEQGPGAQPQVKLRTFDQDTLSGPETQVSTAAVEPSIRPAVARLADGGFVVVWADKRQDQRIRAQRFGFEGTKSGAELRANTVAGLHRVPMVAGLTNGNVVIGWRARLPGPLLVHFQLFDAKGPLGDEQTTNLDVTEATMTALDSGQFVIAHVRNALDGETRLDTTVAHASVFEASGASANIRFAATDEQRILSSWPTLAPLAGGRFLLAWTQVSADNIAAGTHVKAKIFSPTQGQVGQATQCDTSTGSQRFSLCAAATRGPGGETAFAAWTDDSRTGGDTSSRAVRGRPLPILPGGF
jgi:hypothetical protein